MKCTKLTLLTLGENGTNNIDGVIINEVTLLSRLNSETVI